VGAAVIAPAGTGVGEVMLLVGEVAVSALAAEAAIATTRVRAPNNSSW